MYFLIGKKALIKNTLLLAKLNGDQPLSSQNARLEYLRFVQKKQRFPVHIGDAPQWLFKEQDIREYISLFSEKSIVNDMNQESVINLAYYAEGEAEEKLQRISAALSKLKEACPELYDIFLLNIHTVFSAPSIVAGGGSTSGAIGVIWGNPQPKWSIGDIMELLVHEFTHNAMFIDELCHQHYTRLSSLTDEENFPVSAILKKKRPLDKVLHALAVSTEVLSFRHFVTGHPTQPKSHPTTEVLLEQTKSSLQSIKSLNNFDQLLSSRAKQIVDLCEKRVHAIKSSFIENADAV